MSTTNFPLQGIQSAMSALRRSLRGGWAPIYGSSYVTKSGDVVRGFGLQSGSDTETLKRCAVLIAENDSAEEVIKKVAALGEAIKSSRSLIVGENTLCGNEINASMYPEDFAATFAKFPLHFGGGTLVKSAPEAAVA